MSDHPDAKRPREPRNKGKTYPPEILAEDEVRQLVRACSNRAPTGTRNRALLTLLYRTGLRISEALALHPKDLDPAEGRVVVRHGKGDKARVVGLDHESFAVIERWMDRRSKLGLNGRQPVFCTLRGEPVKSPYVRALLRRLGRKAGIEKRVHAHGLRHTHAAELAREGTPMNLIRAQLGHANLSTTSRYLDHIAPQELIDRMRSRSWTP
ncbi:MAG: tyrosine-type recombinase/integrase [Planctomycetia bacterium]